MREKTPVSLCLGVNVVVLPPPIPRWWWDGGSGVANEPSFRTIIVGVWPPNDILKKVSLRTAARRKSSSGKSQHKTKKDRPVLGCWGKRGKKCLPRPSWCFYGGRSCQAPKKCGSLFLPPTVPPSPLAGRLPSSSLGARTTRGLTSTFTDQLYYHQVVTIFF